MPSSEKNASQVQNDDDNNNNVGEPDLILFEDAAFLALFRVLFKPSCEEDVDDHYRFASAVKVVGFKQFESVAQAMECCNDLFGGKLPASIQSFLENNALSSSSSSTTIVGCLHPHLSANITKELGIKSVTMPSESLIYRGLMMHASQLVSSFINKDLLEKTRLALAHAFSRHQLSTKDLSTRDNMIIQSAAALEQTDKSSNTFYMRVKEMYGYHFPELSRIVSDPVAYVACVRAIGDKKNIEDERVQNALSKIFGSSNSDKVSEITTLSKHSVGMNLSDSDFEMINSLSSHVSHLQLNRVGLKDYVSHSLKSRVPNTQLLLGDSVAANFISKAGGLSNLCKLPSSTLQILGAEKALFKAIKSRGKTPKYGYVFNTPYITKSSLKFKGKVARLVANKAALCARFDQYHECAEPVFGQKLREYLEERIEDLEKGVNRSVEEQVERNHMYLQQAASKANEIIAKSKAVKEHEKSQLENGQNDKNEEHQSNEKVDSKSDEKKSKKKEHKSKKRIDKVEKNKNNVQEDGSKSKKSKSKKKGSKIAKEIAAM